MFLSRLKEKPRNDIQLVGAVQISNSSFFVCKNGNGKISLKTGEEEKLQKILVQKMIDLNPSINRLLKNFRIKLKIDTKTLKDLSVGHMNETCKIASGIYSMLPDKFRSEVDEDILKEACILHDMGKVLIPSKVLNKPSKLNYRERRIMNIHSTLGYEMLKTQGLKNETLDLIKYHHQNWKHSGYPNIFSNKIISDIGVQIISTADKYSALREARVYRRPLSRIESLLILYREVLEGKILKDIFFALYNYALEYDNAA
ncbi:MAG: HD domain-containing protein [bacterium]|nr:HD domain-containing protein [bacterium]